MSPSTQGHERNPIPASAFEVDIAPDASALRMFKNLSFTPWYAIGEFVDNSITSALKRLDDLRGAYAHPYHLKIDVEFTKDGALLVKDNAAGISKTDIPRALRTGRPPENPQVGLSRHGVGLKAAGFWWGKQIEITTWPLGELTGWRVEVDVGEEGQPASGRVVVSPVARDKTVSGTQVKIQGLWKGKPASRSIATIRAYLPSIYRMYLADTETLPCTLTLDGVELAFSEPEVLVAPFWPTHAGSDGNGDKTWKRDVAVTLSSGKVVRGTVGILKTLSRDLSGFLLHYHRKGVSGVRPILDGDEATARDVAATGAYKPRAIFGQGGSYADQSLFGEFDVSCFGKSITTDSIQWTQEEEYEFTQKLEATLRDPTLDIWSMARNFRRRLAATPPGNDAKPGSDGVLLEHEKEAVVAALDNQVGHADSATPSVGRSDEVPQAESSFVLHDLDGHTHTISVSFTSDTTAQFLSLRSTGLHAHHVIINEAHGSLHSIPMQHEGTRKLLVRLGIALAAGEVFSEGRDLFKVRNKMNEILDRLGVREANARQA